MNNNIIINQIVYTLLFILLITDISSQIIYTNIPDTIISTNGPSVDYNVDLNGDQVTDFTINLLGDDSLGYIVIKSTMLPLNGCLEAGLSEARNLNYGDTVNSNSSSWNPLVSDLPIVTYLNGSSFGSTFNGGVVDGYLGFRFAVGFNFHYGWLRLGVSDTKVEIVIKDFAYEDTSNYIIIGEGGPCVGTNIILNALSTQESSPGANDGTASVNPSGGTQPYNYAWSNGATSSSISGLTAGSYTVAVTDSNGCFSDTTIVISSLSSIANNDVLDFSISPNPSNGKIQMSVSKRGDYTIVLRNFLGQELKKESFNDLLNKEINISDLKKGIYLISIYSKEYENTIRLIIQ